MQLLTSQFGSVEFEPADLLVFENGMLDYPQDRQWLLLADANNESLYWLQAIADSTVAVPVVEIAAEEHVLDAETSDLLQLRDGPAVLVLAPLLREDGVLSVATHMPIVVNTELGRCRQLCHERHQADQQTMALMSERLRQSA